jgi:hypothetical protein
MSWRTEPLHPKRDKLLNIALAVMGFILLAMFWALAGTLWGNNNLIGYTNWYDQPVGTTTLSLGLVVATPVYLIAVISGHRNRTKHRKQKK